MIFRYRHLYRHLLGEISPEDFDLLQSANYLDWTNIHPESAQSPAVRQVLERIVICEIHREEAANGCI